MAMKTVSFHVEKHIWKQFKERLKKINEKKSANEAKMTIKLFFIDKMISFVSSK